MSTTQITKPKRSVKLSEEEKRDIQNRVSDLTRQIDKAIRLGVSREIYEQIEFKGSTSEATYRKLFPGKEIS